MSLDDERRIDPNFGPFPQWYIPFGNSFRIDHFYRDTQQMRRSFYPPFCWLPATWLWKYSCWLWKH